MQKTKILGVFTLSMINVAAIMSLRGLPATAEYGLSAIFFYLCAAILFFVPCSLIAAELATGWPSRGGVYTWVKQAFGGRLGFLAIWLQWAQNIFFYPVALSFVAATVAYVIDPSLADNRFYMASMIIGVYWFFTVVNFWGMKTSGMISSFCVICGTIFPAFLIVLLAIIWILLGNPLHFDTHIKAVIPDISHISNIVFFVGILLSLAGMEMSAVHANEVKDPQRDYPKAISISIILVMAMFILGSLAISAVVPVAKINLVSGVMEAFSEFLANYHLHFLTPVIAILITLGAVGQINTWIVGPSKGLMWTANDGDLPPFFGKLNKHHMPIRILIIQGIIVTILALTFLLSPTVSSSYWMLTTITIQMYLIMYLLLFITGIKLRYKFPEVKRAYKIPLGNFGMWCVAGIGLIGGLFSFIIGFVPPAQFKVGNIVDYDIFLIVGILIMLIIPNIIYSLKRPSWRKTP